MRDDVFVFSSVLISVLKNVNELPVDKSGLAPIKRFSESLRTVCRTEILSRLEDLSFSGSRRLLLK